MGRQGDGLDLFQNWKTAINQINQSKHKKRTKQQEYPNWVMR
jgi:hypothetical protein